MTRLLELDNFDLIQSEFSSELLWDLFDGGKDHMNLAHECLDRHSGKGRAISVKHDSGDIEHLDYDELIESTSQFAHQLEKSGRRTISFRKSNCIYALKIIVSVNHFQSAETYLQPIHS